MRVAALYDVHGNLPALDAVLADVDDGFDAIVVGGDVAAGPWPTETVARLRALGDRVHWIRGNADRELAAPRGTKGSAPPEILEWVRARMTEDDLAFLRELPLTETLEINGVGRVVFCHATPRDDDELLTRISADDRWARAIAVVQADVVVCGHTHMQFDRSVGGVRVVNAGSVGMPYESEPGAYWLELGLTLEHRRSVYDVDQTKRDIAALPFPDEWPSATPDEATEFFERVSLERG